MASSTDAFLTGEREESSWHVRVTKERLVAVKFAKVPNL